MQQCELQNIRKQRNSSIISSLCSLIFASGNREFFNVKPEKALEVFKQVAKVIDDAVIEETYKVSLFGGCEEIECKHTKTPSTQTPPRKEIKKWMIPANLKYFDLDGCLEKLGYVYWMQHLQLYRIAPPRHLIQIRCQCCIF